MKDFWEMPGWGHAVYAVGGFFTFGLLWLAWLVNMIVIEIHNDNVRKTYND